MSVVPSIGGVMKGEAAFNNERSIAPSMAQSSTSGYRKDIALKRQDLRRYIAEVKLLKKLTDIAQTELRVVEATYLDLKDTLEAKRRSAATNTLLLDKLSLTNRMLIKTLNSLELKADMVDGFVSLASKHLKAPTSSTAASASSSSAESKDAKGQAQPISPSKELSNELMTNKNNDTYLQNMRLKESLLNITRDHFRAVDATFRMSAGMEDLKIALRTAQVKNKQLLKDLAGMRNEEVETSEEKKNKSSEEEDKVKRVFGPLDERMLALVEGGDIDPFDTILQIRKFIYHLNAVPNVLWTYHGVGSHIVSKDILSVFEVGMVVLFLAIPDKPGFMYKYSCRNKEPELVDIDNTMSLAREVMKFGKSAVVNSLRHVPFNAAIDGVSGLKVTKVLSVPLRQQVLTKHGHQAVAEEVDDEGVGSGKVFGVMHFMNKGFNNDNFNDVDEYFVRVFAEQVQTLLLAAQVHQAAFVKTELYSALIRIPTDFHCAIPKKETSDVRRKITPRELLVAAESVLKDALKCSKVRCFLVTSSFIGMEPGSLVYLEPEEDNEPSWDNKEDESDFNPAAAMLGNRRGSWKSIRASMRAGALSSEQLRAINATAGAAAGVPSVSNASGRKSSFVADLQKVVQQQLAASGRDPLTVRVLTSPYATCGLAGHVATTNRSVEVDGGQLPKETPLWQQVYNRVVDLNPGKVAPLVVIPIRLACGYNLESMYPSATSGVTSNASNNTAPVVAVVEFVLSPESPKFHVKDHQDEQEKMVTFMQAVALIQHLISPMFTQLLGCIAGSPAVVVPNKAEEKLDIPDQPNQMLAFPDKPKFKAQPVTPGTLSTQSSVNPLIASRKNNSHRRLSQLGLASLRRDTLTTATEESAEDIRKRLQAEQQKLTATLDGLMKENEALKIAADKAIQHKGKFSAKAMLDVAEKTGGAGGSKLAPSGGKKSAEELLKRQIEMVNIRIDDLRLKLDETLEALHHAETDNAKLETDHTMLKEELEYWQDQEAETWEILEKLEKVVEEGKSKVNLFRRTSSAQTFYDKVARLDEDLMMVHSEILHCRAVLLAADEVARRRDDGIEEELAALAQARQEAKERKEVRDKERSEQPPQPEPQAASNSSSSSAKVQLALLTTALACQEKDEIIAKLEAEYERYLMKKTESEELANALRGELDAARAHYSEKLPMIELLKVEVTNLPHIYERKIKEAVTMVRDHLATGATMATFLPKDNVQSKLNLLGNVANRRASKVGLKNASMKALNSSAKEESRRQRSEIITRELTSSGRLSRRNSSNMLSISGKGGGSSGNLNILAEKERQLAERRVANQKDASEKIAGALSPILSRPLSPSLTPSESSVNVAALV